MAKGGKGKGSANAAADALKTKLADTLKQVLGERATVEMLQNYPDLAQAMGHGVAAPTVAELLVRKVVTMAVDPTQKNWEFVNLIFERVEGKAVQGDAPSDQGRIIEEHLDDVTAKHLNDLASQFAALHDPADAANRPAAKLLDLPQDKPDRAQDLGREPAVAAGTEAPSLP